MSTVNALRLSQQSGAIITDEETWLYGRRRLFISDSIASLLTPEMSDALGIEVVFGGVGSISLTHEVIENAKSCLESAFRSCEHLAEFPYNSIDRIATLCNLEFQKSIKRRINNILRFRYGFDLAAFHQGAFEKNGKRIAIKQKNVIDDCLSIIEPSGELGTILKPIYENEALVAGVDRTNGFQIYEFDARSQEKFLGCSPYCNLGRGADSGAIVLAGLVNKRTLQQRRSGFEKIEGIIELIHSANATSTFNNQVGGYFTLIIIDGTAVDHARRLVEITDHEARLAGEIVTAYKAELVSADTCRELISHIIGKDREFAETESRFFAAVKNCRTLDLLLRGYKIPAIDPVYLNSTGAYPVFDDRTICPDSVDSTPAGNEEVVS